MNRDEVQRIFVNFGALKSMGLKATHGNRTLNVYVEFNEATSAADAVQQREVTLGGRKAIIRQLSTARYVRVLTKGVLVLAV